ncbi:MAG: SDR family oxidoreductase [Anaerolineae bacterium]|nr:SDR family oxidoreductase [Anaerolineae bacterium]
MQNLDGQIIIVTGANAGIGKITALELARMGAEVILACRSEERGSAARDLIIKETGNEDVHLMLVDLSSQTSIREFTDAFKARFGRLDVLVNNAGGVFFNRQESVDGIELTFALNHMGYFQVATELLDLLIASAPARIVNVSSDAHGVNMFDFDDYRREKKYKAFGVYGQSKFANVLFTYELARRLEGTGVTVNALHPGFVRSNFGRNNGFLSKVAMTLLSPFAISEEKGAETSIYLASSPEVEGVTGQYFVKCQSRKSASLTYDEALQQQLWVLSESLLNGKSVSEPISAHDALSTK